MADMQDDASALDQQTRETFAQQVVSKALNKLQIAAIVEDQYNSFVISRLQPALCQLVILTIAKNRTFVKANTNALATLCNQIIELVNLSVQDSVINSDNIIETIIEGLSPFELGDRFFEVTGYHGEFELGEVYGIGTTNIQLSKYFEFLDQDLTPEVSKAMDQFKESIIDTINRNPNSQKESVKKVIEFFDKFIKFLRLLSLQENGDQLAIELLQRIDPKAFLVFKDYTEA